MRKIFGVEVAAIVAVIVFSALLAGWSAPRLIGAATRHAPAGELHAIADAPLSATAVPTAATSNVPSVTAPNSTIAASGTTTTTTATTNGASATIATGGAVTPVPTPPAAASTEQSAPVAATDTPVAATDTPVAATDTPVPAAPPTVAAPSAAVQIAMQHALEQQGKVLLEAIQQGDANALQSMLAARCAGTDVAALITRRQAEIEAQAGVPISQITPLTTYVGHFDPVAGEAHTVLEWVANGVRMTLGSADGWLYEGGQWKDVVCS